MKSGNWRWLKVFVAAVVLAILVAEAGLRLFGLAPYSAAGRKYRKILLRLEPNEPLYAADPVLGWRYHPGQFRMVRREIDGNMLPDYVQTLDPRGERVMPPVADADKQVWTLGCSATHGFGVGDEETFAYFLQRRLDRCQVRNMAVDGYGTLQMLLQYRQLREREPAPDLVIVGHLDDQFHRNADDQVRLRMLTMLSDLGMPPGAQLPYARLTGQDKFDVVYRPLAYRGLPGADQSGIVCLLDIARARRHDARLPRRQIMAALYRQLAREMAADGVPLVVVGIGCRAGWDAGLRYDGIVSVDSQVDLSQLKYRVSLTDFRPSAIGQKQIAERILDCLAEYGILRDRVPEGPWSLAGPDAPRAHLETDGSRARVTLDRFSGQPHGMALVRGRLAVQAGQRYRYQVRLRADRPRPIQLALMRPLLPDKPFGVHPIDVGVEPQTMTGEFLADDDDLSAQFALLLGEDDSAVEVDAFTWRRADATAPTSLEPRPTLPPPQILRVRGGAAGRCDLLSAHAVRVTVTAAPDAVPESVQLLSKDVAVPPSGAGRLVFRARADQGGTLGVTLVANGQEEAAALTSSRVQLGAQWQEFSLDARNIGRPTVVLRFDLGAKTGGVELGHIAWATEEGVRP